MNKAIRLPCIDPEIQADSLSFFGHSSSKSYFEWDPLTASQRMKREQIIARWRPVDIGEVDEKRNFLVAVWGRDNENEPFNCIGGAASIVSASETIDDAKKSTNKWIEKNCSSVPLVRAEMWDRTAMKVVTVLGISDSVWKFGNRIAPHTQSSYGGHLTV